MASVEAAETKSIEPAPALNKAAEVAALSPKTRMRKLHLVRPDLIPYPIVFEVYC